VWARGRCRISPPRFLAECCKRQLNRGSFVLLYFRLSAFSDLYRVCLSVFSCTVSFVSISQVIGCEDRLRNDLYCVEWGVSRIPVESRTSGTKHSQRNTGEILTYNDRTVTHLHIKWGVALGPIVVGAGTRHLPPSRIRAPVTNPR